MEKTGIVISDERVSTVLEAFGEKKTRDINHRSKPIEEDENERGYGDSDNEYLRATDWSEANDTGTTPRKVIRVRVPVARNRTERKHKYTVVRRRPLVTYVKAVSPVVASMPTARRIVVTRVRPRGFVNQSQTVPEILHETEIEKQASTNRHRVTVTRRRIIRPTLIRETLQKARVTRKKLVNVRPIVKLTPTFAIITTGFYSASSTTDEDDEVDNSSEEELSVTELIDELEIINNSEKTPSLEESPNDIDSKPYMDFDDGSKDNPSKFELTVPEVVGERNKEEDKPVIITDHFFFPASDSDSGEEEIYEDEEENDNDYEMTTEMNESKSVSIEDPRLTLVDGNATLKNSNEDILEAITAQTTTDISDTSSGENTETTSLESTTDVSQLDTEDEEESTDKIEEQSEENTESSVTVSIDDADDHTELTTAHNWQINSSTTETPINNLVEREPTFISGTTQKPLTIYIENGVKNVTPQTIENVLTINIEQESVDTNMNNSVVSNITLMSEQAIDYQTIPVEPSIIESDIWNKIYDATVTTSEISPLAKSFDRNDEDLSVVPLESYQSPLTSSSDLAVETNIESSWSTSSKETVNPQEKINTAMTDFYVPSVIPLEDDSTSILTKNSAYSDSLSSVMISYASPTTEDIEAGLADDLYLSLSRPDFPHISSSESIDYNQHKLTMYDSAVPTPKLSTSVYYTESIVTSTKLRTYTYVVTKLNGLETEVTSSTTVKPRITTLTLTVPVTMTISPTLESSAHNIVGAPGYNPVSVVEYEVKEEEEGRRFNLATRVMSNGVEVIVAGPTPALRWENSNPQPTLTLSDTVVMLMPQEDPNEFVTKTCTTTFTYLKTITKNGATIVSTDQQVVANTATEERHRKTGTESASVTLHASPTLRTEVFKTTYTYLTLNTDHPNMDNALGSSMKVITNTVTAPQHYLDMLEPSEAPQPETNTYLSTRLLEKTFMEDGKTRIETTSDTVTQLIVTESAPSPPKPTSVATTLTALDKMEEVMTDITKTYFITYTYLNTYVEKGSTVIHTNIATSTDVVLEKVPVKKTAVQSKVVTPTPEPIQIFATKTYLTTFTYFTTLLQAGVDGETSTTISSRSHIVENVVTESIAPSLLDASYMNALLTTAHHSDSVKNVITGSTIIFFDEDDQIDPTAISSSLSPSTTPNELESNDKVPENAPETSLANALVEVGGTDSVLGDQSLVSNDSDNNSTSMLEDDENKRPSLTAENEGNLQVSNLLNLGSLGINSLSALGPVITAMAGMAGLLQSKSTDIRRNDTVDPIEAQEVTTQRSPIYIPVAEFADGDIEMAESQNIAAQLANPGLNYIPETRHKVAASLADGIPISPGEVITANSDVIIGKPGKSGPRPPHPKVEEHIGMKPPPIPVPNILVHSVLEDIQDDESDLQAQSSIQSHRNTHIQILPAHQIYEKHLKIPGTSVFPPASQELTVQKRPSFIKSAPPMRQASNKQDDLENDPLLVPPGRRNVEQYANPNINPKDIERNREPFKKPWSAKDPLMLPVPPKYDEIHTEVFQEPKPWPNGGPITEEKHPSWTQYDRSHTVSTTHLESSETKPRPAEPIIHQVPHVIDRSTGQPLLVNIQPSQVANVVIPQGGTQALIFGDTGEPHISGQYFDDPSPYPEPEIGNGFVSVNKIPNNPADYMVPPAPPISFKPLPQQTNKRDHLQTLPLPHSQSHFSLGRPQSNLDIPQNTRHDKKPSEVLLIQRPDSHGQSSGQGHVHTEILVHHRPESVNVRPPTDSHKSEHLYGNYQESHEPPRHEYGNPKPARPIEQSPPRRSEIISGPTDNQHQYIYQDNKSVSEAGNHFKVNWKFERKPYRNPAIVRPDRRPDRPSIRPHLHVSHNYPIYERPGYYPNRKPHHPPALSRPNLSGHPHLSASSTRYSQVSHESSEKSGNEVRPLHSFIEDSTTRPLKAGHEIIAPSVNIPMGAVGYHNPSNDPKIESIDKQYYPQLPTVKPEIQSFGEILPRPENEHKIPWKMNTQTERTSDDSISEASEHVKLQDNSYVRYQENVDHLDKQNPEINGDKIFSSSSASTDSEIINDSKPSTYGSTGSINTIVQKPLEIQQNINYENHNKPFNIYKDQIALARPYSYYPHQDERLDYEVIQGVSSSQHADKIESKVQGPAVRPIDHDDAIGLTPPARLPQFNGVPQHPGEQFSRPHSGSRPKSRPELRPRPEHDDVNSNKNDDRRGANRDQYNNQQISISNESQKRPENLQITEENTYSSHTGWPQSSEPLRNSQLHNRTHNKYRVNSTNVVIHNDTGYGRGNQTNGEINQASSLFSLNTGESLSNGRLNQSAITSQSLGTRIHPAYPHILTKPKPRIPGPVTITSNSKRPASKNDRLKIQFSLPVDAVGEEKDSKTQTERPPSMLITANSQKNKKQTQETLETASQNNFATSDRNDEETNKYEVSINGKASAIKKPETGVNGRPKMPSQNMMPPPMMKYNVEMANKNNGESGLKAPRRPSEVIGLSPPPIDFTTTEKSKEDRFSLLSEEDESGLRPPPKYIPLKESVVAVTPPPLSTKMVPPSLRSTVARPFLVDLLSQDMVPPPPMTETSKPTIEIATVRPAIAISGSIQIATAVAASHIPVMQDIESKIPIIHGTVDLPVIMDMTDIITPPVSDKSEYVSIYTVRPFETRHVTGVSVQPTTIITSNLIMPTKLRNSQVGQVEIIAPSISQPNAASTRLPSYDILHKPSKKFDHPVFLEPSSQHIELSMKIQPTQSLIKQTKKQEGSRLHSSQIEKYPNNNGNGQKTPTIVTRMHSSITKMTNSLMPRRDKLSKINEVSGTAFREVMKNGTTATLEMKPKAVTHFKTLTVTRTETSVLGSPPTTRTLLLTHTLTSTIIETVTETLLRPTSVVATVTSTILHSVTRMPNSYKNSVDNDSIFVVMSDQNPPAPGAEEVEAEYGEDEVSRDEQDPAGNEVNRVLAGGIFGAPVPPVGPPINRCQPECKASKSEICSEAGTEARCVCRPGFARMFPDRPCKPTYTYTVRVGLERVGREPITYEPLLNDTSSAVFRKVAQPTKEALDRTMMQSDLRDIYRTLDIAGFIPNPTQVEFHLQLTDNANETRLKDVLRKYLIGSNYSLGGTEVFATRDLEMIEARDFDECSTLEGGPYHDCSPQAGCFNLRGSYQCSCKEGWADLSENPAYPGRVCSQAPLGCASCNNKGHCTTNNHGHEICECFPWHSGQRCQVNLKVLLIALVTTGAMLLGLLAVCLGLACFRHPRRRAKSGDRRAMIPGAAGDTSSEGSVTDLAIPHHVPHILPPPPRTTAPAPPAKRSARKMTPSRKPSRSPRKASTLLGPTNEEHGDRSLTVMIPRAKYRSTPQTPQNYKSAMSTFAVDEHKLINYLESGAQSGNRKPSTSSTKDFTKSYDESGEQATRTAMMTSGALVSAGFQVSATVTRTADAESTIARSSSETALVEATTKTMRSSDVQCDFNSTLARSCAHTSTSTKLLRLDFGDSSGSTMAKSCGDTTIQTSTKIAPSRRSDSKDTRDARDSGSEGHTTMEKDLGSTLRLTSKHPALYKPDRTSDRDSNFDSL